VEHAKSSKKKKVNALNEKILKPSPHMHKIGQCGVGFENI
jgi:hypothetical protein